MENGKTNKVTEMAKKDGKSNSRGEKCLAKFTAANGNLYGSLTLDIYVKQETIHSPFRWLCVFVMVDRNLSSIRQDVHHGGMVSLVRLREKWSSYSIA